MTELLKIAEVGLFTSSRAIGTPSLARVSASSIKHQMSTNLGSPRDDHFATTDTSIATATTGVLVLYITTYLQDTCREYPPIDSGRSHYHTAADNHRSSRLSTTAPHTNCAGLAPPLRKQPHFTTPTSSCLRASDRTPVPAS